MVIFRCAWHPRNYGRAKLLGIKSLGGRGLRFTDALCTRCAARIHPEVRTRLGLEVPRHGCAATIGVVLVPVLATAAIGFVHPTTGSLPLTSPRGQVASPALARPAPAADAGRTIVAALATSRSGPSASRPASVGPRVVRAVFRRSEIPVFPRLPAVHHAHIAQAP
jgi:hypothetical protein